MENIIVNLQMAQRVAQMWHWKVKSFSQHLALGELYDALGGFADDLIEMYMGRHGDVHIPLSQPNHFSEQDPVEFIRQLDGVLEHLSREISEDFILNKFQELQAAVSQVKYKLENLS